MASVRTAIIGRSCVSLDFKNEIVSKVDKTYHHPWERLFEERDSVWSSRQLAEALQFLELESGIFELPLSYRAQLLMKKSPCFVF